MELGALNLDLVPTEDGLGEVAQFSAGEVQEPVQALVIIAAQRLVFQELVEVRDVSVQVDARHEPGVRC